MPAEASKAEKSASTVEAESLEAASSQNTMASAKPFNDDLLALTQETNPQSSDQFASQASKSDVSLLYIILIRLYTQPTTRSPSPASPKK